MPRNQWSCRSLSSQFFSHTLLFISLYLSHGISFPLHFFDILFSFNHFLFLPQVTSLCIYLLLRVSQSLCVNQLFISLSLSPFPSFSFLFHFHFPLSLSSPISSSLYITVSLFHYLYLSMSNFYLVLTTFLIVSII